MKKITDPAVAQAIANIAEDFRFSGELAEIPMMFYRIEAEGEIQDDHCPLLIEYLETGLAELERDLAWRREFLDQNAVIGEARMTQTLQTIGEEYRAVLKFLKR